MSVFKVASRYAKSLIDFAQEQNTLEAIKADMVQVINTFEGSPELKAVLKNPIIADAKKRTILEALFQGKVHATILGFFNIMIKKGRADVVVDTAKEFIEAYNLVTGVVKATVTSAAALSETNLAALKAKIAQEISKEVILTNVVNADLIGGFVVTVGDRQIDASVAGKLNKIERIFNNQGA